MTDQSPSNDVNELADALGLSQAKPELNPTVKATSHPPYAVPYLNDNYTFGDRQNELEMMENLLTFRLSSVREELAAVREINATRKYPNIVFQDPTDTTSKKPE